MLKPLHFSCLYLVIFLLLIGFNGQSQQSQSIDPFIKKETRQFTMPDGVQLATDIYLPIPKEDIKVPINFPGINLDSLTIFRAGQQYLVYDSVNGKTNPNPLALPTVIQRTPYNKASQDQLGALAFLGYNIAVQDTRGRYASEGVYYPFISNGWKTQPYHPNFNHLLDKRNPSLPRNSNNFSDGEHVLDYIQDSLKRGVDTDQDGQVDKVIDMSNGSIGMFGASASGYNQFRAAASFEAAPADSPGLKCLMPLVATGEFHQTTGFQNFVYRKGLVESWLTGTIRDGLQTDPSLVAQDNSLKNSLHTPADYPVSSQAEIVAGAIDHNILHQYNSEIPGFYPRSSLRREMDISRATINAKGNGDPNGTISRYENLDHPTYHISGWWDIFIKGQLETFRYMKQHTDQSKNIMVIGPWTHQKLGQRQVGDIKFPANAQDIIKNPDLENRSVTDLFQSELFLWFRNNLNQNAYKTIGEPKFVIRESDQWISIGGNQEIKAPSRDYYVGYKNMLAFLSGEKDLKNFPVAIKVQPIGNVTTQTLDIPAIDNNPLFDNLDIGPVDKDFNKEFSQVPNVRFYVAGGADKKAGNYWYNADSFPPKKADIQFQELYWHGKKELWVDSEYRKAYRDSFIHDPLNPVQTVGGNNMNVKTPDGSRNSQGPMNLKNYEDATLPDDKILSWESKKIKDSLSIIGTPKMTLNFETRFDDPSFQDKITNTQFFVRVIDQHPDGREFLVTEGAINAYARSYTRKLVENPEKSKKIPFRIDTTSFKNLKVGKRYELKFKLLPIAYTFAEDHKLKLLISSSNYPKYQVDPGLPMINGTFFRWNPDSGSLDGHPTGNTQPRKLSQTIVANGQNKTHIALPVHGKQLEQDTTNQVDTTGNPSSIAKALQFGASLYPNPTNDIVKVKTKDAISVQSCLINMQGDKLDCDQKTTPFELDLSGLQPGVYFLQLRNGQYGQVTKKVIKNQH